MNATVAVPWWLFALMVISSVWFILDRVLIPSIRLYFRRRVNRVIHKINKRLDIEIRPFQRTKKQSLVDQLIFDEQVVQMIRSYSKENNLPYEVAYDKAQKYANEIVPNFNAFVYFRFGYYLSKKLARLLYRVRVGYYDSEMMSKIPNDASVVFVINHRSNLDNVLVSFLIAKRTILSYAVGECARVWPLQSLVQSMGAFFVR